MVMRGKYDDNVSGETLVKCEKVRMGFTWYGEGQVLEVIRKKKNLAQSLK